MHANPIQLEGCCFRFHNMRALVCSTLVCSALVCSALVCTYYIKSATEAKRRGVGRYPEENASKYLITELKFPECF